MHKGDRDLAVCELSLTDQGWELIVDVNGTRHWSAQFTDQKLLLTAALSWKEALSERGWS